MVGLVALDLKLRLVFAGVVCIALPFHILRMHPGDRPADTTGLRVPSHMIADFELFPHGFVRIPGPNFPRRRNSEGRWGFTLRLVVRRTRVSGQKNSSPREIEP